MRFIVADDHMLFRAGLRLLLKEIFGPETEVLEAGDFAGLMRCLQDEQPADLVICDLFMPADDPFVALHAAIERADGVPLIVLSASEAGGHILRSMTCGASGYLVKHESPKVLRHVIELVLDGGRYVPPQAVSGLGNGQNGASAPVPPPAAVEKAPSALAEVPRRRAPELTDRQTAIWRLLAEGRSNKDIARRLAIAESTVKSQIRSIYRKLGVRNRTQAALRAIGEALEDGSSEAA